MFPRIREIIDAPGTRLRVSVDAYPSGALVMLAYPGHPDEPHVMLDSYGSELLGGYIMSARLAMPGDLPDEYTAGAFAARFRLVPKPRPMIVITQADGNSRFEIEAPFWDKLYAELCMVIAHARDLGRRQLFRVH